MSNQLPKWMVTTIGCLLIIFLVLISINQIKQFKFSPQLMNVTASGKITAVPDIATITIGVISEGESPVEVKNKNNQKMNQVLEFIKQQNLDPKDIQTSGFYASPKYDYVNSENSLVGYQANQTVTVTVRNINQSIQLLEKIVDGVVSSGANQIQGINFTFSDPNQFEQAARKLAIEHAKEKANAIATDAHLKLGKIVNVLEGSQPVRPMPMMAAANVAGKGASSTNVEPGSQEIEETVTVVFEVY